MTSSKIHVQGTETDPSIQAERRIGGIQQRLRDRLADLTGAAESATSSSTELAAVRDVGVDELRRYLSAMDEALYTPASHEIESRLLVEALRRTGAVLAERMDALNDQPNGLAPSLGAEVNAILAAHLAVERDVLLPALRRLPWVDLSSLVADLDTLLHGGRVDRPEVLDVREIPRAERHPRIFALFAGLPPGSAFTLVNNHDPKPLRREFEATHGDNFTWDYVESGPERWRVRIGRVERR